MENLSSRNVLLRELPLINNVVDAATILGWSDLTARDIIFYGSVPALIYEAYLSKSLDKHSFLP
jgi:hypothetical protein